MDDDKKRKLESEMTSDSSSWVDSSYFFGNEERERSILNEFGWNLSPLQNERNQETTSFMEFDDHQIELEQQRSDLAGIEKSGDASTSNPSVSSSSSDELPEKSTGSDGKPPEKPSKGRKKGQKRIRQQRFAFMTKSDVDHLEDGYRWRKYGQKAVKNSPYPRSYYRCTNTKCTVKKRVERSCEDPAIVITTYEGQHCHHTVSFPRGSVFSHEGPFGGGLNLSSSQIYAPAMQYTVSGPLSVTQSHQPQLEVRPSQMQPQQTLQNPSDEGLLGDIVPPGMRNR
ncbi:Wrky transcription factor [Thalictrum thalictroides]|uniref:Wrky transcription factor n=1 Tax=Thalictrum thalictroides TaxID=46969 RepID=A0A7J6WVT2_THATH|nr:Wrky transcription factor [Thalictrum thalictroides]